jgi:predicted phage tail protein
MSINRTAKGIVLVPCLLLGAAFLAAAVWGDQAAGANQRLALILGGVLMAGGLLAQLLPEASPERDQAPDE